MIDRWVKVAITLLVHLGLDLELTSQFNGEERNAFKVDSN